MHEFLCVACSSHALKSGETKTSFSPSESPSNQAGKHSRNSLSSCWWPLFLRISVLEPKSLNQLRKRHDYLIRLKHRYHKSFKSLSLRSWTVVELEFLIMDDQQLEDIVRSTRTNLRTWIHTLCLGKNDVRRDDVTWEISVCGRRTRICDLTLIVTRWQFSTVGLCVWFGLKFSNGWKNFIGQWTYSFVSARSGQLLTLTFAWYE